MSQWLANRGYAVLSVNFRGSSGFGKEFIEAGHLEWGGKMQDDLMDAVQWATDEGIADPERIAIMGFSYGGYATLVGMTSSPETFACGVDWFGISNLESMLDAHFPFQSAEVEQIATMVGYARTAAAREFVSQRSPLTHVDQIKRPLLVVQGGNDPLVNQAESDQLVQAMQDLNLPVTYLLYPDEGHGFSIMALLTIFPVMESFLAQCLGGRFEPLGDEFQGASITVPVGAELIPGLAEALAEAGLAQASP